MKKRRAWFLPPRAGEGRDGGALGAALEVGCEDFGSTGMEYWTVDLQFLTKAREKPAADEGSGRTSEAL